MPIGRFASAFSRASIDTLTCITNWGAFTPIPLSQSADVEPGGAHERCCPRAREPFPEGEVNEPVDDGRTN
jgi:hypothetical protein